MTLSLPFRETKSLHLFERREDPRIHEALALGHRTQIVWHLSGAPFDAAHI